MTSRNAAVACLLIAMAQTPVRLTNDERAVIAAAFAHDFPDRSKPLFVLKYLVEAHWTPRALRGRPPQWLDALPIGRPVNLVGGMPHMLAISAPEVVGDDAMFEYLTERQRVDVSLIRHGAKWEVVKENRVVPPRDWPNLAPPPPVTPAIGDGPLRVGGDVKAPVIVKRVEPVSTRLAKKAHISGIVILEVIIDKEGQLTNMHILKPLPMGLDAAAEQAVRQWEFRPGTLHGKPVPVIFNVTVIFRND